MSDEKKKFPKKSPLSAKELVGYKEALVEKKKRIMKDIMGQSEELVEQKDESGDVADQATNILERNINLSLSTAEKAILAEIDEALERIEAKTYGICIDSGVIIAKPRLKAIPEASRTLEAQKKYQKDLAIRQRKGLAR